MSHFQHVGAQRWYVVRQHPLFFARFRVAGHQESYLVVLDHRYRARLIGIREGSGPRRIRREKANPHAIQRQ